MEHVNSETLIDYLHGALSPEADAQIFAHVNACPSCRTDYDAEVALNEGLREYARGTERELPSLVKAAIWTEVRAARPSPLSRVIAWARPAVAVPVLAALAIAAYFGSGYLTAPAPPSIKAAYYLQDHAAMQSAVPFSDHSNLSPAGLESPVSAQPNEVAANLQASSYTADAAP